MATIKLVRIDTRLVHGQICTRWCKELDVNRIIVVDDALSQDSFMSQIYKSVVPKTAPLTIYSVEEAIEQWKQDEFGAGVAFLIVGSVKTAYLLYKGGFPIEKLNVGNLVKGPEKKKIAESAFLDEEEYTMLKEMHDHDTYIFVQGIPDTKKYEFNVIQDKFK